MLLLLNTCRGASASVYKPSASTARYKLQQKANLILQKSQNPSHKKANAKVNVHVHKLRSHGKGDMNNCNVNGASRIQLVQGHAHAHVHEYAQGFTFGLQKQQQRNFNTTLPTRIHQVKDKYGRIITRRIVKNIRVIRNPHKSKNSKFKSKSKKKKEQIPVWRQILTQKIFTPTNIVPQPIQSPKNIKFRPLLEGSGKGGGGEGGGVIGKEASNVAASSIGGSANSTATTSVAASASTPTSAASTSVASSASTSASTTATTAANAANASMVGVSIPTRKSRRKLLQWLRDNAGLIILNIGSIATLTAFTRTDILELRLLSITGSISSVIYFMSRPPPYNIGPIIWSLVFASTNAYMVYHIYEERKGRPKQFTKEECDVYEEHFVPHAVTPRQFEKLLSKAKILKLKRGEVLLQGGESYSSVYLVVSGATEAITGTMSRRVTAASSRRGHKDVLKGGDAGAWVGELAFLEYLSQRDRKSGRKGFNNKASGTSLPPPPSSSSSSLLSPSVQPLASSAANIGNNNASTSSTGSSGRKQNELTNASTTITTNHGIAHDNDNVNISSDVKNNQSNGNDGKSPTTIGKEQAEDPEESITQRAILTYIATEDSTLYEWDHRELADLLSTSSDLRSAITRAMTAAVVGKVVNLYISKADADTPSWKKWFQDYYSAGVGTSASASANASDAVQVNIAQEK